MNKFLSYIAISIFALTACSICLAESQSGVPVAHVAAATHEFPDVVSGTDVMREFEIRNTGDAPLVVSGVKSD